MSTPIDWNAVAKQADQTPPLLTTFHKSSAWRRARREAEKRGLPLCDKVLCTLIPGAWNGHVVVVCTSVSDTRTTELFRYRKQYQVVIPDAAPNTA